MLRGFRVATRTTRRLPGFTIRALTLSICVQTPQVLLENRSNHAAGSRVHHFMVPGGYAMHLDFSAHMRTPGFGRYRAGFCTCLIISLRSWAHGLKEQDIPMEERGAEGPL